MSQVAKQIIIIGAGISGCATAYALAKRGCHVTLIERQAQIACAASGNPVGVLYPRLAGQPSTQDTLALESFLYTTQLLHTLCLPDFAYQACGVLQLGFNAREQARLQAILLRDWPQGLLHQVSAEQAAEIAGIPIKHAGIYLPKAGWVSPIEVCHALIQHPNIKVHTLCHALQLTQLTHGWRVTDKRGQAYDGDSVVIANANDAKEFSQTQHLTYQAVRGQVTTTHSNPASQALKTVVCTEGYITPAIKQTHCIGASFIVGEHNLSLQEKEHVSNLAMLASYLPEISQSFAKQPLNGRASLRCTVPDYLPLVGPLLDTKTLTSHPPRPSTNTTALPWLAGLYINLGHGSKGMTTAPYCAELLAMHMLSTLTLPAIYAHLNPNRFLLRALGLKRLATAPYFR